MSSAVRAAVGYPAAERLDLVEVLHGQPVGDPYRWLESAESPATLAWTAAQDERYRSEAADWASGEFWARSLTELLAIGYISTPRTRGDRTFYTRMQPGRNHPALVVRVGGDERVLLDPDRSDPSGRLVLDSWTPSWQGEYVAVQLSQGGTEDSELWILDAADGRFLEGPIDRVRHSSIGWLSDGSGFYYVRRLPPELNPGQERYHRRVYLHRLGRPAEQDRLIFGDGRDRTDFYGLSVMPAGPWLVLTATTGKSTRRDVWLADIASAAAEQPQFRPVQVGVDAQTSIVLPASSVTSRVVYLRTDRDAPRGRIMAADLDDLDAPWRELVAEDTDAVIDDFVVLDGLSRPQLLLSRRRHGMSELSLHELSGGHLIRSLPLPGCGVAGGLVVADDAADRALLGYADPQTAPCILDVDGATGTVSWYETEAHRRDELCTQLISFCSADGTLVRMFVLAAAGVPDTPRPTILTGYGGFGSVMAPEFRPEALAWVRAGGVYAIACVRGGGEEGAAWHRAGIGAGKRRVFEDFHAAADALVTGGWTVPQMLGILGASNGGLLVGAAVTQHPEKYGAVVCMAPLLDMVRYEHSGMGPSWRPEYGSAADPAEFANLLAYSPYHAVREGVDYPPVLFAVFDGDTRVDLLHARKMCAALQHASTGTGPIVLRTERGVGHGSRAMSSGVALLVDCLAFFAHHLGLR